MSLTSEKLKFGELLNKAFEGRNYKGCASYTISNKIANFTVNAEADFVSDKGTIAITSFEGPIEGQQSGWSSAAIPTQEVDCRINYIIGSFDLEKAYSLENNGWQVYVLEQLQKSVKNVNKIEGIEVVNDKGKSVTYTQKMSHIKEA